MTLFRTPRAAALVALLALALVARPAWAADAKEVKLDKDQQEAVNKLRAKGAAVMQIAADTDALAVNLGIVGKQATDEDLALVKGLPKVTQLDLHNTAVTDAGLAGVAGLTSVTHLHLNGTAVTDAGLKHLKGLAALEYLNLYNTGVTDDGVKQLADLKKLKKLYLWQTKVTPDGAKALKSALPDVLVNRGEELTLPPPTTKPADAKPADGKPAAVAAATAGDKKPVNDKCPVSGKDVDPANTLAYKGKTVGFCCDKCPKQWEKDPEKFAAKVPVLAALAAAPEKPDADKPAADKPAAEPKAEPKAGKKAGKKGAAKKAAGPADIDAEGFVRTWLVFGPIPVETAADDLDKALLPDEGNLKPKDGDKAKAGDKELAWKKVTAAEFFVDFNEVLKAEAETNVAAYAVAYVEAADEVKDVTLLMGSNDQGKVYLNGKELAKFSETRGLEKDTEKAEGLTLNKGTNVVVLKVINEANNWQGCVRLAGKDGKPVKGLTVKPAP